MEKPFLTLTSKDFLTGIAPSAHSVGAGLFYKAKGVTAIANPGSTEATDNGLLRGGPAATDFTAGVVVDNIVCGVKDYTGATSNLFMLGDSGHFYKKTFDDTNPTDLRSGTPITNPSNGMAIFQPVGGTKYLYYWQKSQIGRWDLSGTYATGWTDNQYTGLQTDYQHPVHRLFDRVYYGNSDRIGSLKDDGAAGVTHTLNVLNFPSYFVCTALSDDGIYLAIAITNNNQSISAFADTRLLFWDTNTSSWQREYSIPDPFIISLTRMGNMVIAQGYYGIYECSFDGGVKKILSRLTAGPTGSTRTAGPHCAGIYNSSGYMFAHGDGGLGNNPCVAHLGKIADDTPNAYVEPISTDTSKTVTFIETQFQAGRIYVATTTPKFYAYKFSGITAQTSVSAQTVYLPVPLKWKITRIDAIFGEPLASGDAFDIDTKTDEDTAAVDFGAASFATDGATRRKKMPAPSGKQVICERQFSLVLNFTGGIPKLKAIELYGGPMTP